MISDSQPQRALNSNSSFRRKAPTEASSQTTSTRLVVKKRRRHRVRGQAHQLMNSAGPQSTFLLNKTSAAFANSQVPAQTAETPPEPSAGKFKKAFNGYAETLYKQLLYNKQDSSSNYTLGEARRLAQATRAMLA